MGNLTRKQYLVTEFVIAIAPAVVTSYYNAKMINQAGEEDTQGDVAMIRQRIWQLSYELAGDLLAME